jgi:hypothetical protein
MNLFSIVTGFVSTASDFIAYPEKITFSRHDKLVEIKEKLIKLRNRFASCVADLIDVILEEGLWRFLVVIPGNFVISCLQIIFCNIFIKKVRFNKREPDFSEDEFYIEPKLVSKNLKFYLAREYYYNMHSDGFWYFVAKKINFRFEDLNVKNNGEILSSYRYANRLSMYSSTVYSSFFKGTTKSKIRHQFKFGFKSLRKAFRLWTLPLLVTIFFLFFLAFVRLLPVNTVIFQIFSLLMFFYWLVSGFVFFIKKYKFSKFTSVIQRFWRRAYILFWLLESCLLLVFLYLTLNASQESVYSLDQIAVFKAHTSSVKVFLPKMMVSIILIVLGYLLLLNLKWNFFRKQIIFVFLISVILIFNLLQESYQMFHALNFYSNLFWTYSVEDKLWSLEFDARRTRLVNHYTIILLILKYWHVVFIYFFWVFTALRSNESSSINYPIYSANFQNFVILFIMSFVSLYPQLKSLVAPFLTEPYFWFFLNPNSTFTFGFINDMKLFMFSFESLPDLNFIKTKDFFYFTLSDSSNSFSLHRKQFIKNVIINSLV